MLLQKKKKRIMRENEKKKTVGSANNKENISRALKTNHVFLYTTHFFAFIYASLRMHLFGKEENKFFHLETKLKS